MMFQCRASGRLHFVSGQMELSRPDGCPTNQASFIRMTWISIQTLHSIEKPYMKITCSGHTTVRTTVPHRLDAAFKQERFSTKISEIPSHSCSSGWLRFTVRMASIHITAVAHLNPQPINRGPWALRTARIRY
jgi:hypothetical protein